MLAAGVLMAPSAAASPTSGVAPQSPASVIPAPRLPMPLPADPGDPETSADAKQMWLKSAEKSEAMNEQVLVAQEKEAAAKAAATKATQTVAAKKKAQSAAQAQAADAAKAATAAASRLKAARAAESEFQTRVDRFADASFRGARFGSMSALLTANSAEDFLDTATTLDVIASDSQQTLADAAAAKIAARDAQTKADASAANADKAAASAATAVKEADAAKTDADAKSKSAQEVTADVTKKQADLKAETARLEELYNTLTEQERQAALRAQEEARAEAARQAQARADRAAREQAGAAAITQAAPAADAAAAPNAAASSATEQAPPPAEQAASGKAAIAVQAALSKVGARYVFGASGPDAFDCSGLTSWAWAQAGVTIPRTSSAQSGLPEVPLDQLQPGDLVTYYSPVHHVGMYIGNGQIVHASTSSKPVYVTSVYYGGPNPTGHRVTG